LGEWEERMSQRPSEQSDLDKKGASLAPLSRSPRWRIPDVIDLEFFLAEDRKLDAGVLLVRDHGMFLELSKRQEEQGRGGVVPPRSVLFWQWLQARRAGVNDSEILPGRMFAAAHGLLWKLLGVVGLGVGASVAGGLLRYEGTQPVNVAVYFGALVLPQILLVAVAVLTIALRKAGWLSAQATGWVGILRGLWAWLVVRWHRHGWARLPGERRAQMESFLGTFRLRQGCSGEVMLWPVVSLLQWFGVAFNVGVLAATLWLVTVSDRAFGWQSAVRFEPDQVHAVVKLMARPWSWYLPEGTGLPTLEEVKGSRIILKDGIRSLATDDLVSWWPFLCLAVGFYGLCPRLILLGTSWGLGRRALQHLDYSHVACDRLFERMTSGVLETSGGTEPAERTGPVKEQFEAGVEPRSGERRSLLAQSAVVLLEPEIYESINLDRLGQAISRKFQFQPGLFLPMPEDPLEPGAVWGRLAALQWEDGQPLAVVLQEAWQPPIAENLGFLKRLRKVLGDRAKLVVALIGKPRGNEHLTMPRAEDGRIWEQRLSSLGDPRLRLEPLMDHEG
jgi:hypothetical protein